MDISFFYWGGGCDVQKQKFENCRKLWRSAVTYGTILSRTGRFMPSGQVWPWNTYLNKLIWSTNWWALYVGELQFLESRVSFVILCICGYKSGNMLMVASSCPVRDSILEGALTISLSTIFVNISHIFLLVGYNFLQAKSILPRT